MQYTGKFKKNRLTSADKRLQKIHCPNCGSTTKVVTAGTVYKRHIPGKIRDVLICENYPRCDSYVSVHLKRQQYGLPANYEVRQLRRKAHELQEEIITLDLMTRENIYLLHKRKFKKTPSQCHIRYFDKEMCLDVIAHYKRILLYSQYKMA